MSLCKVLFSITLFVASGTFAPVWAQPASRPEALTWEACTQGALKNHPDLRRARAGIEQARLQRWSVATDYLPKVDVNFSRNRSKNDRFDPLRDEFVADEGWQNRLGVSITESIDLQGRTYRAWDRADRTWQAKIKRYRFDASAVVNSVIDLYYSLQQSLASERSLKARQARTLESRKRIATEVKLGRRPQSDLGEVEHEESKINLELLSLAQEIDSARRELGLLVFGENGASPNRRITVAPDDKLDPSFSKGWRKALQKAPPLPLRGDLAEKKIQIEVRDSERRENYYNYLPDLALKADYSRDYSRRANQIDPQREDKTLTIGLTATWNLFSGGKDYLAIRQSAQASLSDEIEYRFAVEKGEADLAHAQAQTQSQDKLRKAGQNLLVTARRQYESIKAQYDLGKKSTFELLEAELELAEAEVSADTERFKFYKELAKLLHLQGALLGAVKGTTSESSTSTETI